jgi:hypothetical protein
VGVGAVEGELPDDSDGCRARNDHQPAEHRILTRNREHNQRRHRGRHDRDERNRGGATHRHVVLRRVQRHERPEPQVEQRTGATRERERDEEQAHGARLPAEVQREAVAHPADDGDARPQ